MKWIDFFINRPVAASIINSVIIVLGLLAINQLPTREYPEVSTPVFQINVQYPNASAEVVESLLTAVLEEQLSGIEKLDSIISKSFAGGCEIQLQFLSGTDINVAFSKIRDKISLARGFLPKDIEEPNVHAGHRNNDAFFYLVLTGTNLTHPELTHIANLYISNRLRTIDGVAQIQVDGQPYAMRIFLDRVKWFGSGISSQELIQALQDNNVAFPAGKLNKEEPIQLDLTLHSTQDFENIVIKKTENGLIKLKDIAAIQLSTTNKNIVRRNGKPAVLLAVVPSSNSNQLSLSNQIKKQLPIIQNSLPKSVSLAIDFDDADFIRASLNQVQKTIVEAIIFVGIIILFFLRSLKLAIIPLISVPISLVGVLAFLHYFGFSINTVTLIALVLAVGLVVDDAIVILENIYRILKSGVKPKLAAQTGTKEISFAVLAMTLTLASVYIPLTFYSGTIGQIFREFAVTLAGSVLISGFVSLTLTPMMCSRLMNVHTTHKSIYNFSKKYFIFLNWLFYRKKTVLVITFTIIPLAIYLFYFLPKSLAPIEDRGVIGVYVEPIPGKKMELFDDYLRKVETAATQLPDVSTQKTFAGRWGGVIVLTLNPWDKRTHTAENLKFKLQKIVDQIPSINAYAWSWNNGLPGVESSSRPNDITLAIKSFKNFSDIHSTAAEILQKSQTIPGLSHSYQELKLDTPNYIAHINRQLMGLLNLNPKQIAQTLEITVDELLPMYFRIDNIRYEVLLESNKPISNLHEIYIVNPEGKKIALSTLTAFTKTMLPAELTHINQLRSTLLHFSLLDNSNFDRKLKLLDGFLKEQLPEGYFYEFEQGTKLFLNASSTMTQLLLLSLLFIYCILAVQFESFLDPLIILLTVPFATMGALLAIWYSGQSLNVFSQIGIITLIGLITKHGVLLVDFTNQLLAKGKTLKEAIIDATLLRLRPIIMTTLTMVLSAFPLIISQGAGSEVRKTLGLVLAVGLSIGTLLTLTLLPTFCWLIKAMKQNLSKKFNPI